MFTLWTHHLWVLWAHLTGWTLVVVVVCGSALDRLSQDE